MLKILVFYLILQTVNVILATFKNIFTIKGGKLIAATFNALSYSVNVIVVIYSVADFSLLAKIAITALTNFIGTYLGIYILEKTRKERLWEITGTVIALKDYLAIKSVLKSNPKIKYHSMTLNDSGGYIFYIYTRTKEQSRLVRDTLQANNAYIVVHEQTVTL